MEFLLIDDFNGYINIVYKDDGSGDPLTFGSFSEAESKLEENCQDGIVVPLSNSMNLLKRINSLFETERLLIENETSDERIDFIQIKKDLQELFKINS